MRSSNGMILGALAIAAFSLTIPMTRLALPDLGPNVVSVGRTALAGIIALIVLAVRRERFPREHARSIIATGLCGMFAYPLLTALALRHAPAAHGAVVIGFMPALTALWAVVRNGERPSLAFWISCGAGAFAVAAFAVVQGAGTVSTADLLFVAAAVICAFGYAEGANTAKHIGGWRAVFWGQAAILPLTLPLFFYNMHGSPMPHPLSPIAWLAFADLVIVSALIGFLVWYMGLAKGGVARVGQLQLLQLPLSLFWCVTLLGERADAATITAAIAIVATACLATMTRPKFGRLSKLRTGTVQT